MPIKAVRLVIENQIDMFTKLIWNEPERVVWTNMAMPLELLYAAGLIPINIELVAGWLSTLSLARKYISVSEGNGFSNSICSYHKAALGLIDSGGVNRPLGVVVTSNICDGGVGVANYLKMKYGTNALVLNVPFKSEKASKEYLVKQYGDLIGWIENFTGEKLTDGKIKEALELSNEARKCWLKAMELRKGETDIPGHLILRNLFGATFLFGSQLGYEVAKSYYEEVLEKYIKPGYNDLPSKRKRILWIHFAPLYKNDLLKYLEEELLCQITIDITGHIYWHNHDVGKPLESLAERTVSHFYLGEAEERNSLYARIIDEYRIDGVIHMMHSGCRAIPGASWQVRDVADKAQVPYLELSGDCIDPRGFSEGQMKLRLEAFKEMLWRR